MIYWFGVDWRAKTDQARSRFGQALPTRLGNERERDAELDLLSSSQYFVDQTRAVRQTLEHPREFEYDVWSWDKQLVLVSTKFAELRQSRRLLDRAGWIYMDEDLCWTASSRASAWHSARSIRHDVCGFRFDSQHGLYCILLA